MELYVDELAPGAWFDSLRRFPRLSLRGGGLLLEGIFLHCVVVRVCYSFLVSHAYGSVTSADWYKHTKAHHTHITHTHHSHSPLTHTHTHLHTHTHFTHITHTNHSHTPHTHHAHHKHTHHTPHTLPHTHTHKVGCAG